MANDVLTTTAEPGELSRTRRTWYSVLAVVFAVLTGIVLFGWIGLVFGWADTTDGGIHRIHIAAGSGVGTGLFIATPLLILAWRRRNIALLEMVAVTAVAYGIASVIATDWAALAFVPILAIPVVVLASMGRQWGDLFQAGGRLAFATLAVTVVSAIFWVTYGLEMARNQRLGPSSDPHVQMHHWTSMAGMALAIVLLGVLASVRTCGERIVVWLAAAGSAVYGVASIVFATFPGTSVPYPGGEGVGWGLLAIAGGVVLVTASELDRRRSPSGR